jgi:DNA invertase Pin-like site-specific DNA recombinase
MVTRIDRLARSTFGIVKRIVDADAQFRSLAEPWADTGTRTGRLMRAVLGGLADVERDLIRTRTAEGRSPRQGPRKAHGPTPFPDPPNRKRPADGARRARRSMNSPAVTTSAAPRFHG